MKVFTVKTRVMCAFLDNISGENWGSAHHMGNVFKSFYFRRRSVILARRHLDKRGLSSFENTTKKYDNLCFIE